MGVDMKNWTNKLFLSLLGAVVAVAVSVSATDAQAKRMGGGKSVGKSSQTTQKDAAPTNNASSTNTAPAASAAATKAPAAAPAAAASNRSKWLGPLAGLAAGLGLAALASHLGFGEGFANIMMIMLFAMIAFAAFKFFMARRAQAAGGKAAGRLSPAGLTPAYAGASPNQTAYQASMPAAQTPATGYSGGIGSGLSSSQIESLASIPGFDEAGFVRQAKVYFVRLQAAYDVGNKQDLREFTSPEMFAELMMEINERNGVANRTEIEKLDAEFLGQGADSDFQHVSVRFFGMVKEFEGTQTSVDAKAINETWNFAKPLSGSEGWTLVGIEQN
jgi:predicted lipid-binding transport protein (Tim44 family)